MCQGRAGQAARRAGAASPGALTWGCARPYAKDRPGANPRPHTGNRAMTPKDGPARPADAPGPAMIDLRDVELTLPSAAGPVHILRGLSLAVARGETLSVVGPSGSGKSSMMMIVAGLERATAGRVEVAGQALAGLDEDALADFRRQSIGIVFQDFHLVPTMTALENAAVPLELAGRADAFARAEESLRAVGLGHRLGHYPGQLSGASNSAPRWPAPS